MLGQSVENEMGNMRNKAHIFESRGTVGILEDFQPG